MGQGSSIRTASVRTQCMIRKRRLNSNTFELRDTRKENKLSVIGRRWTSAPAPTSNAISNSTHTYTRGRRLLPTVVPSSAGFLHHGINFLIFFDNDTGQKSVSQNMNGPVT